MIFCGLVGATIVGVVIDYTKWFKEVAVVTLTFAILSLIWFYEVSSLIEPRLLSPLLLFLTQFAFPLLYCCPHIHPNTNPHQCLHAHTRIHMYMHTHTHTHTHSHWFWFSLTLTHITHIPRLFVEDSESEAVRKAWEAYVDLARGEACPKPWRKAWGGLGMRLSLCMFTTANVLP